MRFKRSSIRTFFEKRGFYVVLGICVVIIAVTVAVVTRRNIDSINSIDSSEYMGENTFIGDDDDLAVNNDYTQETISPETPKPTEKSSILTGNTENTGKPEETEKSDSTEKPVSTAKPKGTAAAKPTATPKTEKTEKTEKTQTAEMTGKTEKTAKDEKDSSDGNTVKAKTVDSMSDSKPKKINMIMPVSGDLLVEYSGDKLIFSKTLQDWRAHLGIDIKASLGSPVKAVADGEVEKVYIDEKLGITIIIDHGDGIKSKYSNLSADSMVAEKQKVKVGTVISGVGTTASFETADVPHLHFEVLFNDKGVDPTDFIVT